MSSPAEKAAARKAKILERAKKGNSITAVVGDDIGAAQEAAAAAVDESISINNAMNEDEILYSTPITKVISQQSASS